jgi:preprotein translocase subunit SecA
MEFRHDEAGMAGAQNPDPTPPQGSEPFIREGRKIGRNEACPCGSGRKYKHCHGKLT